MLDNFQENQLFINSFIGTVSTWNNTLKNAIKFGVNIDTVHNVYFTFFLSNFLTEDMIKNQGVV